MSMQEDFVNSGHWLVRWRRYLPLMLMGIMLMAMSEYEYPGHSKWLDHLWEAFCLFICFLGLSIRIFTIGHTPKGTSGRNIMRQVANTLNTTGSYSVVRHPLYLGNFIIGLGIALFAHLWWSTLIYVLAFWLYYERIIFAEEEYLKHKFERAFL